LRASGEGQLTALTGGYHAAFLVGALFAALAAVLSAVLLRGGARSTAAEGGETVAEPEPLADVA
jgi:hypothetical protein